MKTHELAALMDLTAKILRELPDGEPIETLEHLLRLARKSKNKNSRGALLKESAPVSEEMVNRLASMSSAQLEQFLGTSEEFEGLTRIRELARHLRIKMSRTQNHAALVNMIVRHFEARRMDFTLRGSQDREPTRNSGSN